MIRLPSAPGSIDFVLASASPARAATLTSAGIRPIVAPVDVEEDALLATGRKIATSRGAVLTPAEEVNLLARAKAEAYLASSRKSATTRPVAVLGCDSMLELDGEMLGKPHTPELAFERIQGMRERDATLWTGHHLILIAPTDTVDGAQTISAAGAASSTIVHFGSISDEEIRAYVQTGEPLEVAGSFTIDGLGGPFVRGVTGDPHAVVGVSLPLLRDLAAQLGIFWPALWNDRPTLEFDESASR